jgi:hypothetical protein
VSKTAIILDDQDLIELQAILLDGDAQEALRFLKKVVWKQVEAARRQGMQSHPGKGQR